MKNIKLYLELCFLIIVSCALSSYMGQEYGFFTGIWYAICFPFLIVWKIFGVNIGIYAQNNSGFFTG